MFARIKYALRSRKWDKINSLERDIKRLRETVDLLCDLLRLNDRPKSGNAFSMCLGDWIGGDNTIDLGKGVKRTLSDGKRISDTIKKK